jgi:2-(1,2-epoxy-1,2-dihydrophenyl)acetyl-CoA isomerase
MGMIWQCVDDAVLLETTMALANRLAGLSARALAATRQVIDEASGLDFDAALSLEARVQGTMSRGHDFGEGVAAFLEKRPAVFTDR